MKLAEPLMETIKDMVAQMPEETQEVDALFEDAIAKTRNTHKNDLEDLTAGFKDMPVFEPVAKSEITNEKEVFK